MSNEDEITHREYSVEPHFGHRYQIEVFTPDTKLTEQLDNIREKTGLEKRDRTKVRITERDIEWGGEKTFTMSKDTFEEFVEWYEDK